MSERWADVREEEIRDSLKPGITGEIDGTPSNPFEFEEEIQEEIQEEEKEEFNQKKRGINDLNKELHDDFSKLLRNMEFTKTQIDGYKENLKKIRTQQDSKKSKLELEELKKEEVRKDISLDTNYKYLKFCGDELSSFSKVVYDNDIKVSDLIKQIDFLLEKEKYIKTRKTLPILKEKQRIKKRINEIEELYEKNLEKIKEYEAKMGERDKLFSKLSQKMRRKRGILDEKEKNQYEREFNEKKLEELEKEIISLEQKIKDIKPQVKKAEELEEENKSYKQEYDGLIPIFETFKDEDIDREIQEQEKLQKLYESVLKFSEIKRDTEIKIASFFEISRKNLQALRSLEQRLTAKSQELDQENFNEIRRFTADPNSYTFKTYKEEEFYKPFIPTVSDEKPRIRRPKTSVGQQNTTEVLGRRTVSATPRLKPEFDTLSFNDTLATLNDLIREFNRNTTIIKDGKELSKEVFTEEEIIAILNIFKMLKGKYDSLEELRKKNGTLPSIEEETSKIIKITTYFDRIQKEFIQKLHEDLKGQIQTLATIVTKIDGLKSKYDLIIRNSDRRETLQFLTEDILKIQELKKQIEAEYELYNISFKDTTNKRQQFKEIQQKIREVFTKNETIDDETIDFLKTNSETLYLTLKTITSQTLEEKKRELEEREIESKEREIESKERKMVTIKRIEELLKEYQDYDTKIKEKLEYLEKFGELTAYIETYKTNHDISGDDHGKIQSYLDDLILSFDKIIKGDNGNIILNTSNEKFLIYDDIEKLQRTINEADIPIELRRSLQGKELLRSSIYGNISKISALNKLFEDIFGDSIILTLQQLKQLKDIFSAKFNLALAQQHISTELIKIRHIIPKLNVKTLSLVDIESELTRSNTHYSSAEVDY